MAEILDGMTFNLNGDDIDIVMYDFLPVVSKKFTWKNPDGTPVNFGAFLSAVIVASNGSTPEFTVFSTAAGNMTFDTVAGAFVLNMSLVNRQLVPKGYFRYKCLVTTTAGLVELAFSGSIAT